MLFHALIFLIARPCTGFHVNYGCTFNTEPEQGLAKIILVCY